MGPVFAQISPGKLSEFHAELEGISNCTKCHDLGEEPSAEKCFACHTALKSLADSGRGFHSSDSVKGVKCYICHSEHNGREFALVFWGNGKETFDHSLTGYVLQGKHLGTDCEKCHLPEFITQADLLKSKNIDPQRTYLGLEQSCASCHFDEHRGQLASDCFECHSYEGWKPVSGFDHDHAGYRLTGLHRKVECIKCHFNESDALQATPKIASSGSSAGYAVYKKLQFANCSPCHRDVHQGKLGEDCAGCHDTAGFGKPSDTPFNHNLTGYPLQGRHAGAACVKCHIKGKMTEPLECGQCSDCHADVHRGQFMTREDGGACETCHTIEGFLPAKFGIAEHQNSSYPLSGSHLAVPCNLCHRRIISDDGEEYAQFDLEYHDCRNCHVDIHRGQADKWLGEGKCESCHSTDSWGEIAFDHELTEFRLAGAHSRTDCRKCHLVSDSIKLAGAPVDCSGCHTDIHHGQFAESGDEVRCEECHAPSGWRDLQFDHNTDAGFKLTGAHEKVECSGCHKKFADESGIGYIIYKPLSIECTDCHDKKEYQPQRH